VPWRELGALLDSVAARRLRKLPAPAPLLRTVGRVVDFINTHLTTLDTPMTLEAVNFATEWAHADDSKVREELGIEYRPLRDTLADTLAWLTDAGHIERKWVN
jgi:UDP-glucose 4-epimerase